MKCLTITDNQIRNLTFMASGDWVVRFTPDMRIEVNPKVTADEAAREFIRIVERHFNGQRPPTVLAPRLDE